MKLNNRLSTFLVLGCLILRLPSFSQMAWFTDGYHGGIYGHYPQWQARFMVEQLEKNPHWAINLEIEPETWDTISVTDTDNFRAFQAYFEKEGPTGRIEFVNPTWSQPYCYNISGESIFSNFITAWLKPVNISRRSFWTTQWKSPVSRVATQILQGFGFKCAVLRIQYLLGSYTTAFGKDLVN